MSYVNEYEEAIAFFQRYPDMWEKLLNGILAKRNRGFDETAEAANIPNMCDRKDVVYAIMCRGSAFDEVARDFAGTYEEYEDAPEPESE